eukprot:TRINITY_DN7787_c0_g1_i1.p1 TRINITY_DN7787_c0_g1~~TRINITY_DN7787_c0_g1_i1.p1  ORF type:complete len:496 (+),score=120.11 TRINITY_DN7787_c0_g1_i1:82-1488(+)
MRPPSGQAAGEPQRWRWAHVWAVAVCALAMGLLCQMVVQRRRRRRAPRRGRAHAPAAPATPPPSPPAAPGAPPAAAPPRSPPPPPPPPVHPGAAAPPPRLANATPPPTPPPPWIPPDLSTFNVTGAGSAANPCLRPPPGLPRVNVTRVHPDGLYAVSAGGRPWGTMRYQNASIREAEGQQWERTRFAVYVPSVAALRERRDRQRRWMRHQPGFANRSLVVVRFTVGLLPDAVAARNMTREETIKYGDIALLPCSDVDTPGRSAAAEKVLLSIHHAVTTLRFDWYVRGADDAWLSLTALSGMHGLLGMRPRLYLGMILRRKRDVGRDMRRHWPGGFLGYASGLGYVLGPDLSALIAAKLHEPASCFNVAWPEDAASGYWVAPLLPSIEHNTAAFGDYDHKDWCPHTVVLLHKPPGGVWDALEECGRPVKCDAPPGHFLKQMGWGGPWVPVKCRGRTTRTRTVRRGGRRR